MQRLVGALAREPQSAKRMPQRAPAFRAPMQSQQQAQQAQPTPSAPIGIGQGMMQSAAQQPLPSSPGFQYQAPQFTYLPYQPSQGYDQQSQSLMQSFPQQQPQTIGAPQQNWPSQSSPFQYQPYRRPQGM